MPKIKAFVDKFLTRLDRLDPKAIRDYVARLQGQSERYREIFQELQEAVLVCTRSGKILQMNAQAASLLCGRVKSDDQKNIRDAVADPKLAETIRTEIRELKTKAVKDVEILAPRERSLRLQMIPLGSGPDPEILILAQEIAGPAGIQDKINRIESLVRLASGIAHEIGNPLNSIMIHLALLKKQVLRLNEDSRSKINSALDVIVNETVRLDRIIKNFLKATRKPPIRFREEDFNELIDEVLSFLKPEFQARGIQFFFRPDKNLQPFLMDRERIREILINLAKNSMDAMPEGGRLWIALAQRGNLAILTFRDEGKGIPEKDLPHIFDAYYTTKKEGSGLGLMTVFNGVQDHGGRIEVASELDKGSTFTLYFPIRRAKLQLSYKAK